jgi:hypothetical protein
LSHFKAPHQMHHFAASKGNLSKLVPSLPNYQLATQAA